MSQRHLEWCCACNRFDNDIIRICRIVKIFKEAVASNNYHNLGDGGEELYAEITSTIPAFHLMHTKNRNLRCSTFGIDPASISSAVSQLMIYRDKIFRFLNPLLPLKMIHPLVPHKVTSWRESRLGIAPRISRSSGPIQ